MGAGRQCDMSAIGFYDSRAWRRVRKEALKNCHNECQICKARHVHVRAELVHHVYHLADYPQWGLCEFVRDPATGEEVRNLLPVCRECHETVCHPGRRWVQGDASPLTEERW